MVAKQIRSLQHKLVKDASLLRKSKRFREETNQILVSGKKMLFELARDFLPEVVFSVEPVSFPGAAVYQVTPTVLRKITGMPSPDGYAAFFPKKESKLAGKGPLLVLDGVQDPGNVGTLLRTALGLKWAGAALVGETADPWGDKALRASKGAPFYLPCQALSCQELQILLEEKGLHPYLADLRGEALDRARPIRPLALILSSEGQGANPSSYPRATPLTLPMHSKIESYNVASSGSILLYALR
ncbi:MAG: RNA methyltransferase [Chlamydiota bacterium]